MRLFAKDIIINHFNIAQEKRFLVKLSECYKMVIKHELLELGIILSQFEEHMAKYYSLMLNDLANTHTQRLSQEMLKIAQNSTDCMLFQLP